MNQARKLNILSSLAATMLALTLTPNLSAGICASATLCDLTLTQGNAGSGFGTGNFGTVDITLNTTTHVATVNVSLASGFYIINTGFAGSIGFADSLGGGLTIAGFPNSSYSGALSDATNDLHFDGFGFANDAWATTGPSAGDSTKVSSVTFTVSKGTSLTDVNQLINLFDPAGGDGAAVFVVDAINTNTTGPGAGKTGLLSAVPEPTSYLLLLSAAFGLVAFVFERRRRKGETAV
jgi:hypothetical protein